MITKVSFENFTVFKKLEMDVSKGVNILVGANGTGKTHLMKAIYTPLAAFNEKKNILDKLVDVFLPKGKDIGRLVRRTKGSAKAKVELYIGQKKLFFRIFNHGDGTTRGGGTAFPDGWKYKKIGKAVFIPVKEMLANAPNFLSLYEKYQLHFEEVYADIIHYASAPLLRGQISEDRKKLLDIIQKSLEGKVIQNNEMFFLKNKYGELEFTLVAEGMRKLGLLWLLIQNGTLLKGSTLFWDEPEANLNPRLLRDVVEILLALQRMGVQIFLATHDYVLIKEFDLQKEKKDNVRFHSLYRNKENNEIELHSTEDYLQIHPNAIADTFADLYDRDIKRALSKRKAQ